MRMTEADHPKARSYLLNVGGLVEGGLVLLALGFGWLAGIDPLESFAWRWSAVAWGLGATVPLFLLFLLGHRFAVGRLQRVYRFLIEGFGPMLAACRWYDLVLLALLAGFAEELLFRGVLQPWMESWGRMAGLIGSNVIFGLAHLITPAYALVTGLIGLYLGLLLDAGGERNLLAPIITHALYDYLAFLVVIDTVRREKRTFPGETAAVPPDDA